MDVDTANRDRLAVSLVALQEVGGEEVTTDTIRLGLHGNGKTQIEIVVASTHHMGHLIFGSFGEAELAVRAVRGPCASSVYRPEGTDKVMMRPTTGAHAGGHEYISIDHEDQEFDLSIHGDATRQTIDTIITAPEFGLHGLHSHTGSQIPDLIGFREAISIVLTLRHEVAVDAGHLCPEVSLGDGYGIAHTGTDPVPLSPAQTTHTLVEVTRKTYKHLGDEIPTTSIEPGCAVAGLVTVILYTVTGLKRVELGEGALRLYVSIDGDMSGSIRPTLYEAVYTILITNHRPDPQAGLVRSRVVGKHCESGDVVARDVNLPANLTVDGVLTVPAIGAYRRSMASNYNLFTRPGVRWAYGGESGWALRPEIIKDLVRLED